MRLICNLRFAAKLKKKSSNNSSAAFGIGVSAMISSIESVTAPVSAVIMVSVSASDVLFPVQDEDEKQTMPTKIASITTFLILQLIHLSGSIKPSNFWQKYNFISINFFISLKNITFAMFFYKLVNKLYNYNMLEKIEELLKEVNNLTASNAEEIEQLRARLQLSWLTSATYLRIRRRL